MIKLTVPKDSLGNVYVDDNNCGWTYFVIDHLAGQDNGVCSECGTVTFYDCYVCLDDDIEVCTNCVNIVDEVVAYTIDRVFESFRDTFSDPVRYKISFFRDGAGNISDDGVVFFEFADLDEAGLYLDSESAFHKGRD